MPRRSLITSAAMAALLSCGGCIVTSSTYDGKVREVEALRDAYASSNRESSRLSREVEELSKQVAGQKGALRELASRADACEAAFAREKREPTDSGRELEVLGKRTGTSESGARRPAE